MTGEGARHNIRHYVQSNVRFSIVATFDRWKEVHWSYGYSYVEAHKLAAELQVGFRSQNKRGS